MEIVDECENLLGRRLDAHRTLDAECVGLRRGKAKNAGDHHGHDNQNNLEHGKFRMMAAEDYICTMPPLTIHGVPKRSTSMPNASAQNVFSMGIVTLPPSESAPNTFFASAAVG